MKSLKIGILFAAVAALGLVGGCATTGMNTGTGNSFIGIYTEGHSATEATGASKRGEACTSNILGVYAGGDASVDTAKKDGNITKVSSIESKIFRVSPFYGSYCTVVMGE